MLAITIISSTEFRFEYISSFAYSSTKLTSSQLLQSNGDYKTWTRWGRVGERGQSGILGSSSLADAIHHFESKFKSKSGLAWANRGDNPKPGKYTFIERSYTEDSDDEGDAKTEVKTEENLEAPESKLDPAIQDLMELIFNQQ
jgi:poly [ADP-ribose] polymerase